MDAGRRHGRNCSIPLKRNSLPFGLDVIRFGGEKAVFGANLETFASKLAPTKLRSLFITKYNKDIGINSFLIASRAVNFSAEG